MKINKFLRNKKILITGANGFKGAWLSYWLYMAKAKVIGIGGVNKNEKLFKQLSLQKKIKFKYIDIREKNKLEKFIKKNRPSIIFHLAAQAILSEGYRDPFNTITTNAIGTLNLLEICKSCKFIKSIVCVTSDKCYKNNHSTKGFKESDKLGGVDPYSASKACAEIIAESYTQSSFLKNKIGLATGRAGNVIGGGDSSPNRLIPDSIKYLRKNKTIYIRRPNFNRPWQHVLEPLYGYLVLSYNLYYNPKKYSGAWNFGPKKNSITTVYEIVKKIIKYWGEGKVEINQKKQFYEQENLQLNLLKSNKYLKWYPKYSINQSIKKTVDWYKEVHLSKGKSAEEITRSQILSYINEK